MLLHLDGFDSYTSENDLGMEYSHNCNFATNYGRFGGGGCNMSNYRHNMSKTLPSPTSELWMGIAWLCGGLGADYGTLFFSSAAGPEVAISYNASSGQFKAWRGNAGSLLGISTTVALGSTTWHWIEARVAISSAGAVEIWVDGVRVLNLASVNTSQSGATAVTSITIGGDGGSSLNSAYGTYDDWYILDTTGSTNNSRLGDCRIETLKPTSDAGPNDGTPSSGSDHYAMVNENQWNTSNYDTLSNTSGQAELFGFNSLGSTPSAVFGVRVLNIAQKTDAGAAAVTPIVKSGTTTANGSSTPLLTSWAHQYSIFETDPNTSSAWTGPSINAMKAGLKVT